MRTQRADKHTQRVHGLAQVVTGSSQKAGFRDVGFFGHRFLQAQILDELRFLLGAAEWSL